MASTLDTEEGSDVTRTVLGMLLIAWLWVSGQPTHGSAETRACEYAAAAVPEFGGAYLAARERDGVPVLHVWLTDATAAGAVREPLRQRCPEYDDVVFRDADYSFSQLTQWRYLASTLPEVTATGVDSRTNRLAVGVADLDADRDEVMADLAGLGIPPAAVNLAERRRPEGRIDDPVTYQPALTLISVAAVGVVAGVAVAVIWVRRRRTRPCSVRPGRNSA